MARRNPLSWYSVTTPEWTEYHYSGVEPPETMRDWLGVQAYTKKEAISRAVRHWLKDSGSYVCADRSENPFKGIKAELMEAPGAEEVENTVFYLEYDHDAVD